MFSNRSVDLFFAYLMKISFMYVTSRVINRKKIRITNAAKGSDRDPFYTYGTIPGLSRRSCCNGDKPVDGGPLAEIQNRYLPDKYHKCQPSDGKFEH